MPAVFAAIQLLGVLAVLVGPFLLLPLGGALIVDGALAVVLATAFEVAVRKARSAPSDGRSGSNSKGVG